MKMRSLVLLILLPLLGSTIRPASDDPIKITEWRVPWEDSRPRDPYVAPDGKVWFCGQRGDYIANLDPKTGEFKRYEVPDNSHPHNLIVDADGMVWYAGNTNAHIGKMNPATGAITQYPMPEAAARDPHTLVFDRSGHIWFTVQGGNFVGRLTKATGRVDLVPVRSARARPYGIKIDPQDRPWIVLFGTNRIATVDPATMALTEIPLPRAEARPRRIEITSDGHIWYVDYAGGMLGRMHPTTHAVTEWPLPGGKEARPYGTARDDLDRIWLVETGMTPNRFVGFDPATESFFSTTEVESGGGTIRHMYFHPTTREVWFGTDTNYIGRAQVHVVDRES
jgi:virginiamycin B lyase